MVTFRVIKKKSNVATDMNVAPVLRYFLVEEKEIIFIPLMGEK